MTDKCYSKGALPHLVGNGEKGIVDFVVPCYNESANIAPLYQAFLKVFEDDFFCWRLIMVDDGSEDDTWAAIAQLAQENDNVVGLRFSRNFGKEAAIYAGLEVAGAEFVGIIDADLQQPPSIAREMLQRLFDNDAIDGVAAYQQNRREGALMSALKSCFYRVFAKASQSKIIQDASDFRVFRHSVAEAVLSMPEYYRFSKGIFSWVGFEVLPFPYIPDARMEGESKWSTKSLFKYAIEGMLSFTTAPLHSITIVGVVIFFAALVYAAVLIVRTLIMGVELPGYASTVSLILLLGGGQFLSLGIIGEYLARAYVQGKKRPLYIVRSIAGSVSMSNELADGD